MADKVKRPKVRNTRHHRLATVKVRKDEDRENVLTFVASTEVVARDQDVIRADGWQLENYRENPQFLWAHNAWDLPIGRGVDARIVLDDDPRLEVDVEFAGEEENSLAPRVQRMYERGFLRAVSVGYWILGYEVPDQERRDELGMGPWGVIVTKAELLELSAVTVPADPTALLKDGQVPRELKEELLSIRSHVRGRDREEFDELLRGVERRGSRGSGGRRKLAAALADLQREVRGLRKELRARPVRKAPVVSGPADDPYGILNDIDTN